MAEKRQQIFFNRLSLIRGTFGLSDPTSCVAVVVGDIAEALDNQKTIGMNALLMTTIVDKSLIVVTHDHTDILCEEGKEADLKAVFPPEATLPSPVLIHTYQAASPPTSLANLLGSFTQIFLVNKDLDTQNGPFAQAAVAYIKSLPADVVKDSPTKFSDCFVVKDEDATINMTKSGAYTAVLMKKYVAGYLDDVVAGDAEVPITEVSHNIAAIIKDPRKIEGLEKLSVANYGLTFDKPFVLSGGGHLKLTHDLSDRPLTADCVVCAYGVKYLHHISYIARTFLYNSTSEQQEAYSALLGLHDSIKDALVPGKVIKDVVEAARSQFKAKHPTLDAHLFRNFGFGTGLEVMESRTVLSEKSTRVIEAGMSFVVRCGLENVTDAAGRTFSILLADTIMVQKDKTSVLSTYPTSLQAVMKKISSADDEANAPAPLPNISTRLRENSRVTKGANLQAEEERKLAQKKLMEERAAELAAAGGKRDVRQEKDITEAFRLAQGDIRSYAQASDLSIAKPGSVCVDKRNSSVILPGGLPFHVATLKAVDFKAESGTDAIVRFQFNTTQETYAPFRLNRTAVFIKEIACKVKSNSIADQIVKDVRFIQSEIKTKESERKQQSEVIQQKGLVLSRTNDKVLRDVRCYPNPKVTATGRQGGTSIGNLEAHENGLRYTLRDQQPLVLLYNNIKSCIFQPSDNDPKVVIHFHLIQAIQVGKKKSLDLQFYLDVVDESETVQGGGSRWDDEVDQEDRERQRVVRLNTEFRHFATKLESVLPMKVQTPVQKFSFQGTHDKAMVKFHASRAALFSIMETPTFVQEANNIEIAVFERVTSTMRTNFDLTFVRPDYTTGAISNIDHKAIDKIKDWLSEAKVRYYESGVNVNWKEVFKTIKEEEDWNPWGPDGWDAILGSDDEDGSDSDDDDDSDSEYIMSDSDEDDSDDTMDSKIVSDDESSSDDSDKKRKKKRGRGGSDSDDDSDDDEEGLDWDDLERLAAKEDAGRGSDSESDDHPRKKRSAPSSKPAAKKAPMKAAAKPAPKKR
eukprot:PhF_6_TR39680/c0_g1_i1/m.58947